MFPRPDRPRRGVSSICGLAALGLSLVAMPTTITAQHLLCVVNNGKLEVVRKAEGRTAFVQEGGKWVSYPNGPFALQPMAEYAPALVAVEHRKFGKGPRAVSDNGPLSNVILINAGRFVFNANLDASRSLDNVVLLLVLSNHRDPDIFYLREIGHLDAHEPKRVSIDEITQFKLLDVRLKEMYVFTDGQEVFSSRMPKSERQHSLDAMISRRVAAAHDGPPRALYVEDAIYPPELKPKIKGQAVISCRVNAAGKVVNPMIASATSPEFGPVALEAVRNWRFIPAVKDGKPADATVEVPVEFTPPPLF
jgi:TonB family protein